jgi:hypothetical protein
MASLIAANVLLLFSTQGCKPSPRWGYLANSGSPVPIKGTYFFPGDAKPDNQGLYTFTPFDPQTHLHWTSETSLAVLGSMKQAHINVVVMSYWGADIGSAPMQSTSEAYDLLFDAAVQQHMLILPAVEVFDGFPKHFGPLGDAFVRDRIIDLVRRYIRIPRPNQPVQGGNQRASQWAKVYDQDGTARYAIQLLGVASTHRSDNDAFVQWLDDLAKDVSNAFPTPISIGFMVAPASGAGYTPIPGVTHFEKAKSFLAIQGFISEVTPDIFQCKAVPYCDNNGRLPADHPVGAGNLANRETIAAKKRSRLADWIKQGLPVVIDINPGFDGHYVWGHCDPLNHCTTENGYWGDNAFYYDDDFRNYTSQMRGMGNVGITFNSWNQYTDGSVAVPSKRVPFPNKAQGTGHWNSVQFDWLKDMYATDPRQCNHVHYVDGGLTKFYVYGAICEHWQTFGHDGMPPSVTFGAPTTSEMDTPGGHGRMNRFTKDQQGSAIYYSDRTEAHEVHGTIYNHYVFLKEDTSYLGLPTTDELSSTAWCDDGKYNAFEHGWIDYCPDGRVWGHSDPRQGFPGRNQ